jgi:2-aminoethylphosphonate-pyruvate transaminase
MSERSPLSTAHDKPLFTPGPLTTSRTVKQAMLRDLGSRDREFIDVVREIREELLVLGGVSRAAGYECVLLQGSGTYGIEAVISSIVPRDGKLLVLVNGAYGERMVAIAGVHGVPCHVVRFEENELTRPEAVERALESDPAITHVAVVHCETTTGILNPIASVGRVVKGRGKIFFVDSMSAFGAIPTDAGGWGIDYLVSSANKCIEGVPGFSFALCRRDDLVATHGRARTLALDLCAQWQGLEANGQFRFTPPTHALLAFHQALRELREEGGVAGRNARYRRNHEVLAEGMRALGFETYLAPDVMAPIITSFHYPRHPRFRFEDFYTRLSDRGFVIYPGKLSKVDCFRVGTIGRIFPHDVRALVAAIAETLRDMGVEMPRRRAVSEGE